MSWAEMWGKLDVDEKIQTVGVTGIANAAPVSFERLKFLEHLKDSMDKQIAAASSLITVEQASRQLAESIFSKPDPIIDDEGDNPWTQREGCIC
jgi:hypothetical protein